MAIIDKVQGAIEKLTNDDTRLNTAEITTLQQSFNAMQVGLAKVEVYLQVTQNQQVRDMLTELRDEFLKPNLNTPKRFFTKVNVPFLDLRVEETTGGRPKAAPGVLRDEEILLDTVLAMQATITGLQAGALAAVRGDVRDFFLNARDAAMGQWRKIGQTTMKVSPQLIPPTISATAG